MNEENKTILENEVQSENVVQQENQVVAETQTVNEYSAVPENSNDVISENKPRGKSKSQFVTGLSTSIVTVVAAALVGITTLLNVSMNAEFTPDTTYADGNIKYVVNVENMTEKETLKTYLYEGDTLIDTIELVDEDGDGVITGAIPVDTEAITQKLAEGDNVRIQYRLTLAGIVGLDVERTFDSYVINIDKFESSIEDVEMWCSCQVNGYYNFKINFSDPLGKFTDFEAYIEDGEGNIATCEFTDDLHEAQKIFVNQLQTAKCKLFIKYKENGVETFIQFNNTDDEDSEVKDNYKNITL